MNLLLRRLLYIIFMPVAVITVIVSGPIADVLAWYVDGKWNNITGQALRSVTRWPR